MKNRRQPNHLPATARRRRVGTIFSLAVLAIVVAVVDGFASRSSVVPSSSTSTSTSRIGCNGNHRRTEESTTLREATNDIDVVGEGRRGDAKGAALRLVDVAVSRGGSTLLSNIDWRVEPKSKWGLVVSTSR